MDWLSFRLNDKFVEGYSRKKVNWGFPIGGGNYLGELVFIDKYSRKKDNGGKEKYYEVCRRVVEGVYSILKDHCKANNTPWNEQRAQAAAQEMYDAMFYFKWLPPGRGLQHMGTEFVHGDGFAAALQNCAFVSTAKISHRSEKDATLPFVRLMEMSMLGVGVGFDVEGEGNLTIHQPTDKVRTIVIADSREGWVDSLHELLVSYFFKGRDSVQFDYSEIRGAGEPIKRFGGTAAGPGSLIRLHDHIRGLFDNRAGETITVRDIADICNMIGECVVAGNVRRSAEIALGDKDDEVFLNLKNYELYPERQYYGWASNNTVKVKVGDDYSNLVPRIIDNGEPGLLWLDTCRNYGRLIDPPNYKDVRAAGTNPCSEQTLESFEMCTLVETFPFHADSKEEYLATLKHAYLYGKAVTLLKTHWPEVNEVMQRNRRIGTSVTGMAQFVEARGYNVAADWLDSGYDEVQRRDRQYSEWLGVRESIKTTSVKPSGTVSLLAGATPGAHWPVGRAYIRRLRFNEGNATLEILKEAGYKVEEAIYEHNTMIVELPAVGPDVRVESEVSIWEKAELAAMLQKYWADNQVSVTVYFSKDEADQIEHVITAKEGQLKSISFLPQGDEEIYAQAPYEYIDPSAHEKMVDGVSKIDFNKIYRGKVETADAVGERFCNNDTCELPQ